MENEKRTEVFDFVGAFEQAWVQYSTNAMKTIPYGIAASLPFALSYISIIAGAIAIMLLEGFFLILLADAINATSNMEEPKLIERLRTLSPGYFKQGLILSVFITPLLAFGFVALVIPSIVLFGFFIFSFFQICRKNKFAIDACMESLRMGNGCRLHIFLLALIIYTSSLLIYFLCESFPWAFIPAVGIVLPYFFTVIQEFFEQLEIK